MKQWNNFCASLLKEKSCLVEIANRGGVESLSKSNLKKDLENNEIFCVAKSLWISHARRLHQINVNLEWITKKKLFLFCG